ncbi:carboxypeptidase-like regulatory domain-containing protein [Stieleria varia]|uniref:Cna protein B-type domain protein n=1 Tax=Stieleria varia TaxID=2528005 RepID=A0A5C6AP10_9BACT|nr:carboxypeptidase-like regulatory domain-containing protein [Stieleria varia]TWU01161.1 Cna protein B-type domain protein [Stieleria varia]
MSPRLLFLIVALLVSAMPGVTLWSGEPDSVPHEEESQQDSASDARKWLINGTAIDWETGEPIDVFRVIPGTPNPREGMANEIRAPGGLNQTPSREALWQPHQIREMRDGKFQWPRTSGYRMMRFRVEADGYQPVMTPWTERGGPYTKMRVYMRRDLGLRGAILAPDGQPAADAVLAIALPNRPIQLEGTTIKHIEGPPRARLSDQWRVPEHVRSDASGQFDLPMESDPNAVLCVVHPAGIVIKPFELIREEAMTGRPVSLTLQRWSSVSGRVTIENNPVGDALLFCTTSHEESSQRPIMNELVTSSQRTRSDENGNYRFENVPPGTFTVYRRIEDKDGATLRPITADSGFDFPQFRHRVDSGADAQVNFGGEKRTVIGNLVGLESFDDLTVSIMPCPDMNRRDLTVADREMLDLLDLRRTTGELAGWQFFRDSDEGHRYFRTSIPVAANGSFQITNVSTGNYWLEVNGAESGLVYFEVTSFGSKKIDLGRVLVRHPEPVAPLN